MSVSFPQATGCYDRMLQFHSIKHHLKPTLITVWLPQKTKAARKIHRSLSNHCNLQLFKLSATLFYLLVMFGRIDMIF